MACQYLYPHGSQNKNHFQCCGCDCCYRLASQGIWGFRLPDEYTCLKMYYGAIQSAFLLRTDFKKQPRDEPRGNKSLKLKL